MPVDLSAVCFAAHDPLRLSEFWAGVLGRPAADQSDDGAVLVPTDDTGFRLRFRRSQQPKSVKNQAHLDLTSASDDGQRQLVATALALGAQHVDIGQSPEERHVVLADPEGNEFCVIEAGNAFLADCGLLGAVACDGSRATGYFWHAALGWPLVWDQDQETAIQAAHGGPKITWGGPVPAKLTPTRLRFDVTPLDGDQESEIARLVALGATRVGTGADGAIAMTDPGGNEFCVLAAR